ncbi:MAG: exosortase O, partial [Anaerolineales bacterium]|nr:exosortase O [Anaerolineales bacterium]
ERFVDVHTVAASLFGLASYGLLGLWLAPARWRQGLPAALLLILTLPFGEHMETFIGYPLRIATAVLVRDGLAALGVGAVGVDTILVFENGVSQVDVPCSGVQSLWTGAMFLIAATWIEGRRIGLRWVGTAVIFALALVAANLARVAILVSIGEVLGWRLLAEMLHVPLGVLGFIAACALALHRLRRLPKPPDNSQLTIHHSQLTINHSPTLALLLLLTLFALLHTPRPQTGLAQPAPAWQFPSALAVTPLPLKPDEVDWLVRDGAESASRYRFSLGEVSGSLILIPSRTWRAHHRPERCFEVYGLTLDDTRTHLVTAEFPTHFVRLGQGENGRALSATYWFQSAAQTTDDYGTRLWADLAAERQRWVLVSILFDDDVAPDHADARAVYLALQTAVAESLR